MAEAPAFDSIGRSEALATGPQAGALVLQHAPFAARSLSGTLRRSRNKLVVLATLTSTSSGSAPTD